MSNFVSLLNTTYSNDYIENIINKENDVPKISLKNVGLKILMSQNNKDTSQMFSTTKSNINPIYNDNIILLCYGEIYNSKELFNYMDIEPTTQYSYEIIIHLYKRFGIEHTLRMIDGTFSFLLLDNNVESENFKLYVARDSYGVKPLYILNPILRTFINDINNRDDPILGFSTDKHMLYELYKKINSNNYLNKKENKFCYELKSFLPGTYSSIILSSKILSSWITKRGNIKFHMHGFNSLMYSIHSQYNDNIIIENIQNYISRSIDKRCKLYGSSKFVCYLNGEIQNNILAGLVNEYNLMNHLPTLKTYSIGLKDSDQLINAKKVADYLKTEHTEFILNEDFFLKESLESILDLECYNDFSKLNVCNMKSKTPTPSINNVEKCALKSQTNNIDYIEYIHQYFIGKYIKNDDITYIFNGNGINQLFGSLHLFSFKTPPSGAVMSGEGDADFASKMRNGVNSIQDPIQYDLFIRNSIEKIFLNELFISDLSLYYNGIIPSSPFLDRSFVEYYLSIPPQIRFDKETKEIDKYFLRMAFSEDYFMNHENMPLLPHDIIFL